MKTEKVDILKIEFEGEEATNFKKAVEKIVQENNRAGFNQTLDPDEKKVINDLHEKIK
jgi:hypothetical protein